MNQETKTCQNCKAQFTIEPDDFVFYEKMKVPPPTFCPTCRFQRRLMFRNERVLYRRTCDLCKEQILSIFSPQKPYKVFCQPCWWSDKWDGLEYGQEYDPSRIFFEQLKEVQLKAPLPALFNAYTSLVNSEYVNHVGSMKNCYFCFNADYCDNVSYSTMVNYFKDSLDCFMASESELCYELINCGKQFNAFFSEDCLSCHDIYFSNSLTGCSNCFGCVNLRNKKFHIFNEPYTKAEYEEKLKEFNLHSYSSLVALRRRVYEFWVKFPRKFTHDYLNSNSSGDYVYQSKNAQHMYQAMNVEDGKYSQWITLKPAKDIYDLTEWGNGVQRIYDSLTIGEGCDSVKFCFGVWSNCKNVEYSMAVLSSSDIFGSVSLRKKQYCILNKQYGKEEYEVLRERIIRDMKEKPYIDAAQRKWAYGEFFPYDMSMFDYNESSAIQYFELDKDNVLKNKWRWAEISRGEHAVTMKPEQVPDSIHDAPNSIPREIFECIECKRPFRVINAEFELLKRFELPLPRKCPDCRQKERIRRINPPRFLRRGCSCAGAMSENGVYKNAVPHFHGSNRCPNSFITAYQSKSYKIIYCEQCINAEVV